MPSVSPGMTIERDAVDRLDDAVLGEELVFSPLTSSSGVPSRETSAAFFRPFAAVPPSPLP